MDIRSILAASVATFVFLGSTTASAESHDQDVPGSNPLPTAAASTLEVPAHQFNTCSNPDNSCWRSSFDQTDKANLVSFLVRASDPRPWVVTLNELCDDSYNIIAWNLVSMGYTPTRFVTVPNIDSCPGYGIAIFTLGSPGYTYTGIVSSGSEERRAIVCRRMSTYGGAMEGCVTHTNGSAQTVAVADRFNSRKASATFGILGGDLNKRPNEYPLPTYFTNRWYDIDYRSPPAITWSTQSSSQGKIDYLFIDLPAWRTPDRLCSSEASDHCYLFGSFFI